MPSKIIGIFLGLLLTATMAFGFSKEEAQLLKNISNKTFKMQYVFFKTNANRFFLSATLADGFYIWLFDGESKAWKEAHTPKNKIFTSFKYANKKVTIGAKVDGATSPYDNELSGKTYTVSYYFWLLNKQSYLISPQDTSTASIWHFTKDKSWRPLNNAPKFKNFRAMGDHFTQITFDFDALELKVGEVLPFVDLCLTMDFCKP